VARWMTASEVAGLLAIATHNGLEGDAVALARQATEASR
jgi:hypothetical protein